MKKIKNKKIIIIVVILVMIFLSPFIYVEIGKRRLYSKTFEYLTVDKGYHREEFEIKKPTHSFINRILSYREWNIGVVFKDELIATYYYGYDFDDNNIIKQCGVSGGLGKHKHFEEYKNKNKK